MKVPIKEIVKVEKKETKPMGGIGAEGIGNEKELYEDYIFNKGQDTIGNKSVDINVKKLALHLYENQPECFIEISKERRAEACYDIASAISRNLKDFLKEVI